MLVDDECNMGICILLYNCMRYIYIFSALSCNNSYISNCNQKHNTKQTTDKTTKVFSRNFSNNYSSVVCVLSF